MAPLAVPFPSLSFPGEDSDLDLDHVPLVQPRCRICDYGLTPGKRCSALLGNDDSTGFKAQKASDNFLPPANPYSALRGCPETPCRGCHSLPEVVCVHQDCLRLFKRHFRSADALDRLWVAAAWRYPWRSAPPVLLSREPASRGAIRKAAEIFDLAPLVPLPQELWGMIQEYSENHSFWRFVSVFDFVNRLRMTPAEPATSVALDKIVRWKRGSPPELSAGLGGRQFIRLTIDSVGISEVERLPARSYKPEQPLHNLAFVTENEDRFNGVSAQFKYGLLRLISDGAPISLAIWDTPSPPFPVLDKPEPVDPLVPGLKDPRWNPDYLRLRTIDLKSTTGLTFFAFAGTIQAIHAHTATRPCANTTFDAIPDKRDLTWIYVPLAANGKLRAFATHMVTASSGHKDMYRAFFLFRTELAGDILVGRYKPSYGAFFCSRQAPATLVYNSSEFKHISAIEYSSEDGATGTDLLEYTPVVPENFHETRVEGNVSWAPLENVGRVQVFYCDRRGTCVGLLFTYKNDSQRAVGECRLGVDRSRVFEKPARICFQRRERTARFRFLAMDISFSDDPQHSHPNHPGTSCSEMSGPLLFRFSRSGVDALIKRREFSEGVRLCHYQSL